MIAVEERTKRERGEEESKDKGNEKEKEKEGGRKNEIVRTTRALEGDPIRETESSDPISIEIERRTATEDEKQSIKITITNLS